MGLHRVLRGAIEAFDAKMLLDPFEKQLYLPTALVERADCQRWQDGLVGEEYQRPAALGILEADTPQMLGVMFLTVKAVQGNALVAYDACGPVGRCRIDAPCVDVGFGAGHKETSGPVQRIKARVVQVCAVHDVESAGFGNKQVEDIDVVHLSVGDVDETRNGSSEVQKGMHLDGCFGGAERRPRKHGQAQVDGRGVQGIDRIGEVDAKVVVDVELPCLADQSMGEIGVDTPVAGLVGIGQGRARNRPSDAHMVKLWSLGRQTRFDVAKALPVCQLGEGHDAKLLGTAKCTDAIVSSVAFDDAIKRAPWEKIHYLGKQGLACVHRHLRKNQFRKDCRYAATISSRHHPKWPDNPFQLRTCNASANA